MHDRTITYSPAYTIVPTYECFNRCSYCNFRRDPGKSPWLTIDRARAIFQQLRADHTEVIEILILSGEVHPHSHRRSAWFEHIYQLCQVALEFGFLPHTNVGPLSYDEMCRMKQVNASMGLMLEQLTPNLQQTVHRQAPSKDPELRLQQITWAGELKIPFTTGILLGLGETEDDRFSSLQAIAEQQAQFGHIQEVILQPYSPGSSEAWGDQGFPLEHLPRITQLARNILPATIAIQIPPNLVDRPQLLLDCLAAGARDLGGISPHDEVNPDYPHPTAAKLRAILTPQNRQLHQRLPVYPQYDHWLSQPLKTALKRYRHANITECV